MKFLLIMFMKTMEMNLTMTIMDENKNKEDEDLKRWKSDIEKMSEKLVENTNRRILPQLKKIQQNPKKNQYNFAKKPRCWYLTTTPLKLHNLIWGVVMANLMEGGPNHS